MTHRATSSKAAPFASAVRLLVCLALAFGLTTTGYAHAEPIPAPTIDSSYEPVFDAIAEDSLGDEGLLIGDLLNGSATSYNEGSLGIALVGMTGQGTWEGYYNNTWWNMDSLSPETAIMLKSDMKLRFVPAADWNGTATITYRAWDVRNDGPPNDLSRLRYDVTENGGSTPYSADTQTASIEVTSVNDAPRVIFPQTPKLLNFNGSTDYVTVNNLSLKGEMTFEAWVYSVNPYATWSRLFDFGNGSPGQNIMVGFKAGSGQMFLHNYTMDNQSREILVGETFPTNDWVHVEVTIDENGVGTIYWDGVLKASGDVGPIVDIYRKISYIGRSHWGQDAYFNGKIRDIRFWNYARTPEEIAADKISILTGKEEGLVGYMPMLESEGTYLNDLTGRDISGNIVEADWVEDADAPLAVTIQENTNTGDLLHGIYTTDPDAEDDPQGKIAVRISVPRGSIHLPEDGIEVVAGANDSDDLTIEGPKSAVDAALNELLYTPPANFFGTVKMHFDLDDNGYTGEGGAQTGERDLFVVVLPNTPAVTPIDDQFLLTDESTSLLPFTLSGGILPADELVVTVQSSNLTLLPLSGIELGGTGANRTVQITPAEGQEGEGFVTLTVSDGRTSSSTTFYVLVESDPDNWLDGWLEDDEEDATFVPGDSLTLYAASYYYAVRVTAAIGDQTYELELLNSRTYSADGYKYWGLPIEMPFVESGEHLVAFTAYDGRGNVLPAEDEDWLYDNYYILYTPPAGITTAAEDIGTTTATVRSSVVSDGGGEAVAERGIVYGLSGDDLNLETGTVATDGDGGLGEYSLPLSGLTPGAVYYVRAYAVNEYGVGYSAVVSFRTLPVPAGGVTAAVETVGSSTATVLSAIASDGGAPVTERGVVYGLTEELTLETGTVVPNQGSGTGTFSTPLSGLTPSTVYYVRTYAVTEAGIVYSEAVRFETSAAPAATTSPSATPSVIVSLGGGTSSSLSTVTRLIGSSLPVTGRVYSASGQILSEAIEMSADGTLKLGSLAPGEYRLALLVTAPNGEKLAGQTAKLTVDGNGNATLEAELIDPYGTITDRVTGTSVPGAKVVLYWADTELNRSKGRVPGTEVSLPALPDFAPNQNANPQFSTEDGKYGWMVPADGDYYLIGTQDNYVTFDSREDLRDETYGIDSYIKDGIIHVGTTIVPFSFTMMPELLSSGEHTPYMKGYPDGQFKPERGLSRSELAAILSRIATADPSAAAAAAFSDLPAGHWAAKAIALVARQGWMNGVGDGKFAPEREVTRAELVQTLANLAKWSDASSGAASSYSDVAGHWAAKAIAAAEANKLVSGYPDGTFQPNKVITRAEAVAIINKFLNRRPWTIPTAPAWEDVSPTHWAYSEIMEASVSHSYKLYKTGSESWE
ncbi:S-layer homology domain-containing protein [Cohnella fermenti]|uniref:Staphylococcus aureus surface protein A n=1 Tax=Cohnella fermenti TaxID=2565925 RepID=A0A4S4C8J0_9BACL|nr:S-layer homology domain-containing protein [Cohnella fermenti]THF83685.1 hypothetical protein E6C55_03050 [Cohnella fermenti]